MWGSAASAPCYTAQRVICTADFRVERGRKVRSRKEPKENVFGDEEPYKMYKETWNPLNDIRTYLLPSYTHSFEASSTCNQNMSAAS